ncbi:MAG: chemotaxis-specific protein-glutamate methyltransferase CheB [Deltaproteobacteria bacterium]|nr:chemotaxis-specific protein-glutamate methyltransferase CheB [Deltaproteobacteria bacterium]MBN2672730.1 chemotaxis-specific protein-glutamate methyltransferase CheB [Deltaproteobacteria bacterium]
MIRLLIAEDSTTVQRVLRSLLEDEPNIEVVGVADNGEMAVEMCRELRPDIVTMDIFMPKMTGLEATRQIMSECPTRIVIISSMVKSKDTNYSFEAMRAGAVEVIEKPTGILSGKYQEIKKDLVRIIKNTIRTRPDAQLSWLPSKTPIIPWENNSIDERSSQIPQDSNYPLVLPELICIGGSTGAPTVIVEILSQLPADYPIPIVVAQHISKGFAQKMSEWLNSSMPLNVQMAHSQSVPVPGNVLVCPDHSHATFSSKGIIKLVPPTEQGGHVPSIDRLFKGAAEAYGETAVGVILSGMGKDGADGLLQLRKQKAYTIGQSEETSVVYGMNRVAAELGAVSVELSPIEIADQLLEIGKLPKK